MMEINDLIQQVVSYSSASDTAMVLTTAYEIAEKVHRDFQRLSGESVLSHALAVASILAEWHAPSAIVAVALLHDVHSPDYSHGCDLNEIESRLGAPICKMLKVVLELNNFVRQIESDSDREAEADLHYLTSILYEEPNAVIIKLADRLHNLRSFPVLRRYYQEHMGRVGFNVFTPLADQLGMGMVKRQLEDYSFEVMNPAQYRKMKQYYENAMHQPDVHNVLEELLRAFAEHGIEFAARWQEFSLYSLYRRRIERNAVQGKSSHTRSLPFRLLEAGAFIVLTGKEAECYQALGLIHKLHPPVKGQFKDLIAIGEENGYRALHTQVRHSSGNVLNISIRTSDMDVIDERGITARWWNVPEALLPQLSKQKKSVGGELQVFTQGSEIKYVPRGATVLDSAYSIHTEVGHSCAGALVNGKQVDAYALLQNGDRIEIIRGGANIHPLLDWLNHVRTSQASSAIRQWLVQNQYNDMLARGRALLDQQLQSLGLNAAEPQVSELLNRIAAREAVGSQEELLAAIGVGRLDARKLVDQLKSMRVGAANLPSAVTASLSVRVMSSEETRLVQTFARCCRPVPFDEIIAFRSDERLIVHKRACPRIKEEERPVPVEWDSGPLEPHYVAVIEALNRPGLAHDITSVIVQLGLDMNSFNAYKRPDRSMAESHIYLGKTTATQRTRLQRALETVPYVTHVEIIHSSVFEPVAQQLSLPITYHANPYGPGVAKGSRFYGRKLECERIVSYLSDQEQNHAILLWGQRRIGKTSLLLRLQEQAQGRFLPVYIDLQSVKDGSNTQFLHQLMSHISAVLRDHDVSQEVSAPAMNRLRKDPLAYFDTYLSQVERLIKSQPLALILDEFQCLCNLREEGISHDAIFSRLRSQSLHGSGFHLVLSGGGLMNELLAQTGITSLFNITHDEKLTVLEAEAAHKLMKEGLIQVGGIGDPAIDLLLWNTGGHPYYLQLLCSYLYEQAQEQRAKITRDFVATSIRNWIQREDNSRFQHFWEGYNERGTRRNKLILSAIAHLKEKSDEFEYDHLAAVISHVVPTRDIVQTLDDLTNLGVLKYEHSRYTMTVRLFTSWLRQHWPLPFTLKEGN
ncbi:MAG: HD domain-containing protein [Ktedonobacteraceae bacterium]